MEKNNIIQADCREFLDSLQSESIDLIVTSPPYADIKKYGKNISVFHPDHYNEWFLPIFEKIPRILKPSGSFILNINDRIVKKKRHPFVFEIITSGIMPLYDLYIWYKKAYVPTGSPKRTNNATEYILHFCKNPNKIKINLDNMREPHAEATLKRNVKPVNKDEVDENGRVIRKKAMRLPNPKGKIPTNVFRFNTSNVERGNVHPAPFNKELPTWFIKALTDEGDVVFDPFCGSGTTCLAAKMLNRQYIGIDLNEEYVKFAKERLK